MANALNTVLRAEGYQSSVNVASSASVMLLPLQRANKVVVFAADERTLDHVEAWVEALDASRKDSIEEAVFTYEVRNTQAEELVETLNQVLGAGAVPAQEPRENRTRGGRNEGGESGENDGQPRRDNGQPLRDNGQLRAAGQTGGRIVVDRTGTCCSSAAPARSGPRSGASSRGWTGPGRSLGADRGADRRDHPGRRGADRVRVPDPGGAR